MDRLNRAYDHGKELFLSLSPAMRLVAVLLMATVVVGLGYLSTGGFGGGDGYLLGGRTFNASEITAAEKSFAKAGLSGARFEGARIQVPRGQESLYVAAMADEGVLPADFHLTLEKTLEKLSPFTSPKTREEWIKNGKQRELSNIIRSMSGIDAATVIFDRRRQGGFPRKEIVTASVVVWPELDQPLPRSRLQRIRKLVASSIAGLKPADVTVTTDSGGGLVDGGLEDLEDQDPVIRAMRAYQQLVESKVLTALAFVPGVRVAANVEVSHELESSEETKDVSDQKKATVHLREKIRQSGDGSSPAGGDPGVEAQSVTPNRSARLSGGGASVSSGDKSDEREQQFEPSRSVRRTRTAGLTPKSVSVTVAVPTSYYDNIQQELRRKSESSNPPTLVPSTEDIEKLEKSKIEDAVANVIRTFQTDKSAASSQVHVASFVHIPPPKPPGPAMVDRTLGWLSQYWTTLGLFGLSAFSLVVLRSMVKSIPPSEPAPQPTHAPGREDPDQGSKSAGKVRQDENGPSLRDELTDIVREDPEAAAKVIRGWIDKAS